jgi:hypothetical protein
VEGVNVRLAVTVSEGLKVRLAVRLSGRGERRLADQIVEEVKMAGFTCEWKKRREAQLYL